MQRSEQEIVRREAMQALRDLGVEPYPAAGFAVNFSTNDFKTANFDELLIKDLTSLAKVGEAGAKKLMELFKAKKFRTNSIKEEEEFIAMGINDPVEFDVSAKREPMDLETYISGLRTANLGAYGPDKLPELRIAGRFMGQRGPFAKLQDADGTLRNLPIVKRDKEGNIYDAFTDPELRYRQRYVDLVVNPQVREAFVKRTKMYNSIRNFLNEKDYLEVETPILQPLYGGAAARPFKTHHNTLDMTLYLRIANELYLKRLIVGGFDGVYEFSKDFRNEGMSRFHNPEFTQIELYVAYKDYEWMMNLVEEMVEKVAMDVNGTTKIEVGENIIDFKRPWKRYTMYEAIEHFTGIDISEMSEKEIFATAKKLHIG